MHVAFSGSFFDYTSLFANLKRMSVLFIHETLLVYKLETFTNWKEVKHIMIIIINIIYIFLYYEIFDQQLKITFRKSSAFPQEKIEPPFLLTSSLKFKHCNSCPFLPTLKVFQAHPRERRGGGRTLCFLKEDWSHSSQFWFNKIKQYIYLRARE